MSDAGGILHFQETSFDGLQFIQCDYHLQEMEHVSIDVEDEVLEMHFRLRGASSIYRNDAPTDLKQENNMLTFLNNQKQEVCMLPVENGKFYEIRVGVSHFEKLMLDFYASTPGAFNGKPCCISPKMNAIIAQINAVCYTGKMKALFLEAKMTELFLLQLEQHQKLSSGKHLAIKQTDKGKIQDAKQLIVEHLDEFITISRLAEMVGINQRKLMQGFKEIFGYTIYQYISELKMETARDLLINSDKNVNEIAYHIGYQNTQHFISAFKKRFEISPGKLKNKN
ncbi:Regulatory protein PchR [compost metagenome]